MSLRRRLQVETAEVHRRLDELAAECGWFDTRTGYCAWLRGIHAFHKEVHRVVIGSQFGHLLDTQRCERLDADMADIGAEPLGLSGMFGHYPLEGNEALGLLYVAEGSRLGSRVLCQRARLLGFTQSFGARFLSAEAADLTVWRRIVGLLDGKRNDARGDDKVVAAGLRAFRVAEECFNECRSTK